MSDARFFVERLPAPGDEFRITGREAAHARARRLSAGDRVRLFDGSGREVLARIVRLERAEISAVVERLLEPAGAGPELSLLVAGARPERLSWIAEKATELGVDTLTILRTVRTQSFRASEATRARLERVARAAARQCGAARWPRILGPLPAAEALAREPSAHRLLLDPEGEPFPERLADGAAALAVGPEGGWTPAEWESARRLGWTLTAIPAGRLRAETAVVAGLALLRAALTRGGS